MAEKEVQDAQASQGRVKRQGAEESDKRVTVNPQLKRGEYVLTDGDTEHRYRSGHEYPASEVSGAAKDWEVYGEKVLVDPDELNGGDNT